MSFILNIDTAVQSASVCLSENEKPLVCKINPTQKDHASWLHVAIRDILDEQKLPIQSINAIALSAGPGSYTGLRVSMAAAKGLCYALNIPLITLNTLQIMAAAATGTQTELLCPMIDARRMEVFTATYNRRLEEISASTNLVLQKDSFVALLDQHTVCFFGNGSLKFRALCDHPNAAFRDIDASARDMTPLAFERFSKEDFADLAYTEPFYGKDFHSTAKQSL